MATIIKASDPVVGAPTEDFEIDYTSQADSIALHASNIYSELQNLTTTDEAISTTLTSIDSRLATLNATMSDISTSLATLASTVEPYVADDFYPGPYIRGLGVDTDVAWNKKMKALVKAANGI